MVKITVAASGQDVYRVTIEEGESRTTHDVTVTADDVERYALSASVEQLVEASFRFLLEREPKESILSRFPLPVIERYFSDYPVKIREKL
jgi:hypothetical protein